VQGLEPGTTSYYRVCPVDTAGQRGPFSLEAAVRTKPAAAPGEKVDVAFPGKGVSVAAGGRAGVAEEAAEDIREKVRQQGGFLELVCAARGNECGPIL
jgi:hypothetical protein